MPLHFEEDDDGRSSESSEPSQNTMLMASASAPAFFSAKKRASMAPMLPADPTPQMSTWHTGGSMSSSMRRSWRPLGATWREWEKDGPVRNNVDDGREFVSGCVPHWGKETGIRLRGVVEHELTWSYYRMRKHEKHPQRQEVGELLPQESLNEKMRFGRGSQFHFWRDLRPPFYVLDMKRVDDGSRAAADVPAASMSHPDGELYNIRYECAIEYFAERLMDTNGNNGTFNNKVRGVAQVRIPNGFPQKRPIHIVTWGRPTLNPPDMETEDAKKPKAVDPGTWNPIAHELGLPPSADRLAKCRTVSQETTARVEHKKKIVKVPELQRLLLGPHASLPRLAKMQATVSSNATASSPELAARPPPRVRKHTIFTPAVGFVSYAG
mmetsp:Transcript_27253/g.78403  ORF Transcript_27253/g.78403 Transcript_27253/m.78403 type:complete len:381 (+) Transcript_27253:161-1303(+)